MLPERRCRWRDSTGERCVKRVLEGSRVCVTHLCEACQRLERRGDWLDRCPRRAVNGQAYCDTHLAKRHAAHGLPLPCRGKFRGGHWACPHPALPGTCLCQRHYRARGRPLLWKETSDLPDEVPEQFRARGYSLDPLTTGAGTLPADP